MSHDDHEEIIMSETDDRQADGDSEKLVPVTESIRYRKRAQSAEKKAEQLAAELKKARDAADEMLHELSETKFEQKLAGKLISAGVVDLESALLIVRSKVEGKDDDAINKCVERLHGEKAFLFNDHRREVTAMPPGYAGSKQKMSGLDKTLADAADRAIRTGKRTDVQEYLRLRRNII